jgi:hypothetical protein
MSKIAPSPREAAHWRICLGAAIIISLLRLHFALLVDFLLLLHCSDYFTIPIRALSINSIRGSIYHLQPRVIHELRSILV